MLRGGKNIAIVLPAYEPDPAMLSFIQEMQKYLSDALPLLVIDDGSDQAKCAALFDAAAAFPHCSVIRHDVNRGKGAALKTAFAELLDIYKDDPAFAGCVTADCDAQHSIADIMQAVELLGSTDDRLILGCRDFTGSDVPWKSRFGNNLTRFVFCRLLHLPVSDTQTGLRGIPVKLMAKCLEIQSNRFEMETEMLLISHKSGCSILEYPIQTIYVDQNSGTHFHPIKDALKIYGVILRFFFGMFFRFFLSALSSAALDIGLFSLLFYVVLPASGEITVVGYVFDFRVFWACIISRVCSSLWNFFINRKLVFKSASAGRMRILGEMAKYYLLAICILTVSWFATDICSSHIPEFWLAPVKLLIDSLLFAVSYIVQRLIIFKGK